MNRSRPAAKNVFILGISSDIGKALAERYLSEGYSVTGTYRHKNSVKRLSAKRGIRLLKCDVGKSSSIKACIDKYKKSTVSWDIFIS